MPDTGTVPRPRAPFAIANADGLVHVGTTDRRGAISDPVTPEGTIALVRLDVR
jgi:hypothetical protein